jgi:hypothetical protein
VIVRSIWSPKERAAVTAVGGDARVATALHGPVPLPLALGALGREQGLPWPVKLALCGGAAALLAEAPRLLPRAACDEIALAALESGLAWLVRGQGAAPIGAGPEAGVTERALAAAASLGFRAEPAEAGAVRVYATPAGREPARVRVAPAARAALVTSTTSLRLRAPRAGRAVALFCLEASARLRWVRLSAAGDAETARIVWEIAVPPALPETALAAAIEAVAVARAETARAFGALAEWAVSEAYLASRGAAAGALGEHAGGRPAVCGGA